MKKTMTIRGVRYDLGNDTDLESENNVRDLLDHRLESLRQTPSGKFYVHTQILQMYKDDEWVPATQDAEWLNYIHDTTNAPWKRKRCLDTILAGNTRGGFSMVP